MRRGRELKDGELCELSSEVELRPGGRECELSSEVEFEGAALEA